MEIVPEMTGKDYVHEAALFRSLTPIYQFSAWYQSPANPLDAWPLVAVYGLMLVVFWILLRRRVDQHRRVVDSKLKAMEVVGTRERGEELAR